MQMFNGLKSRPIIMEALAFGIYYFIYLLSITSVSYHGGRLFSAEAMQVLFAGKMLVAGLGYLSFPLVRRRFQQEQTRRSLLVGAGVVVVLGALGITTIKVKVPFVVVALLTMFALGHVGGFIYYSMSQVFVARRCPGRAVGVAAAIATGLHFIIQSPLYSDLAFLISVALGMAILLSFVVNPPRSWILSDPLPAQRNTEIDKCATLALLTVIALLTIMFRVNDDLAVSIYSTMKMEGSRSTGLAPLAMIPGILFAGWVADRFSGRRLSILVVFNLPVYAAACTLLLARQIPVVNALIMYFCGGIYVVFITVFPMRTAARSAHPTLWAGMGRVVRNLTVGLTGLPMTMLSHTVGWWFIPASSAVLASVAILVMILSGMLDPPPPETGESKEPPFAVRHGLTELEWQVCQRYVLSEDSARVISEQMYLSQRTVERYIQSVYEKTGTHSRVGLVRLYFEK